MNDAEKIRVYFQTTADRFDKIYSGNKSIFERFIDKTFRVSMRRRFERTLMELEDIKGRTVLDVGCGSGRYSVFLAMRGAGLVTGIDFAENMLNKARALAEESGVSANCRFISGDFLTHYFEEKYDICLAIGLYDYIAAPDDFLKRMAELSKEKIIISFPAKWRIENISRKMRLLIAGCPVRFYTVRRIKKLLERLNNMKDYKIVNLGRDYLVIINLIGGL